MSVHAPGHFQIQSTPLGDRVWVHSADGTCVGRYNKTFGIDIHQTLAEQERTGKECLYCVHNTGGAGKIPGPEQWEEFRIKMMEFYGVEISADLIKW